MNYLIALLILNSVGVIVVYILYRVFNWLLIERSPILNPARVDRSLYKPYFFARENGKLIEKCPMDQLNLHTTKTLTDVQVFDKTIRNESTKNSIDLFSNEKTIL